jgi:hypothetical protein
LFGAIALPVLSGCASSPPPAAEEPKPAEEGGVDRHRSAPSIESEIGAMDEGKVKQIFQRSSADLSGCFNKGAQRIPYLAGEVRFVVRVSKDGSVRWAFIKESSLGDRETEACMLGVLKSAKWPKPEGGEGLTENSFNFEPGGEERPPVAWSSDQLGAAYKNAKGALAKCRKGAGTKGMKVTMYVDTDGKASGVGVSSADERGEAGVSCVVDALKALKFPSPGSYASKVSLVID